MATTIKNADLFITERLESNYSVTAEDLRDFVGVFEPGTRVLFNNATAPNGWVNVADSNTNQTALRIVKAGGGTTGGSGSFNTAFDTHAIKASQHKHAVTENNHSHKATIASHKHTLIDPGHTHALAAFRAVHQHTTPVSGLSAHGTTGVHACFGNNDGGLFPHEMSSIETGDPSAAGPASSKISVANAAPSYTSGNNGALGISVNNTGSSVNWDFNIKYNDFMICEKSPY